MGVDLRLRRPTFAASAPNTVAAVPIAGNLNRYASILSKRLSRRTYSASPSRTARRKSALRQTPTSARLRKRAALLLQKHFAAARQLHSSKGTSTQHFVKPTMSSQQPLKGVQLRTPVNLQKTNVKRSSKPKDADRQASKNRRQKESTPTRRQHKTRASIQDKATTANDAQRRTSQRKSKTNETLAQAKGDEKVSNSSVEIVEARTTRGSTQKRLASEKTHSVRAINEPTTSNAAAISNEYLLPGFRPAPELPRLKQRIRTVDRDPDEMYEKLHRKREIEEKRIVRLDKQRQRELAMRERLLNASRGIDKLIKKRNAAVVVDNKVRHLRKLRIIERHSRIPNGVQCVGKHIKRVIDDHEEYDSEEEVDI